MCHLEILKQVLGCQANNRLTLQQMFMNKLQCALQTSTELLLFFHFCLFLQIAVAMMHADTLYSAVLCWSGAIHSAAAAMLSKMVPVLFIVALLLPAMSQGQGDDDISALACTQLQILILQFDT